jgi:hypothetical protein
LPCKTNRNSETCGRKKLNSANRLFRIFNSGATAEPLDEILALSEQISPSVDHHTITSFHHDIQDIFSGTYPGFKENGNKYHNLRHTYSVALATIRLFHGLSVEGYQFSEDIIVKGILSSYFHDTGLLLRSFDTAENGAEFTRIHEDRSISSLHKYLDIYDFSEEMLSDCSSIIRCTDLECDIDAIEFNSSEVKLAGQILGSADVLAQMADRYYLERLPFLFQERHTGGLNEYPSAFDLMKDTKNFYRDIIVKRLKEDLGNSARAMRTHFNSRWNINRDLYTENIEKNITYLQKIIKKSNDNFDEFRGHLRRHPPAE